MGAMTGWLVQNELRSASLWVAKGNSPAREFYERLGGELVAERSFKHDGYELAEVAYGWDNLEGWPGNSHQLPT